MKDLLQVGRQEISSSDGEVVSRCYAGMKEVELLEEKEEEEEGDGGGGVF